MLKKIEKTKAYEYNKPYVSAIIHIGKRTNINNISGKDEFRKMLK